MDENRKIYEFILEAGLKLNARSVTTASASLYCYRFLQKLPPEVSDICPYTAATACLYLAGKLEEDYLKIRDLTNVCHRILHPDQPPLEVGDLYWSIRDGIGALEQLVVRTLAFQVQNKHPHTFLLQYLKSLGSWCDRDVWEKTPIGTTAWSVLRDSYIYPKLHHNEKPQLTALAILQLSMDIYGIHMDTGRTPWYRLLFSSASSTELNDIVRSILTDVYQM